MQAVLHSNFLIKSSSGSLNISTRQLSRPGDQNFCVPGNGIPWAADAGTASVRELDWLQSGQLEHFQPVDFVLATDCVYNEDLIPHLLRAVLHLCTDKTTGAATSRLLCCSHAAHLGILAKLCACLQWWCATSCGLTASMALSRRPSSLTSRSRR